MSMRHQAHRYQEMEVKTASKAELIVLLYDGAIGNLQKAQEHIRNKDIANRVRCLNKATSILTELQTSLNFDEGGEIAGSLDRLYRYMKDRLFQANLKQDGAALQEVAKLLDGLRSAWIEVARNERSRQARSAAPHFPAPRQIPPVPGAMEPRPDINLNIRA